MSVKALVRLAKRSIRDAEWGSIEFSSTHEGNSVRVHRAIDLVPAAKPTPKKTPAAPTTAEEPQKLSGKMKKKLRFIRHGTLTRMLTSGYLKTKALKRGCAAFGGLDSVLRSLFEVLTKQAPATEHKDADMADAISTADAAQPSAGTGPGSPARQARKATKRAQSSPGAGKKTGRKE